MHARQHGRDDRAGQLVNQLAEHRVFLRRPADDRERPDRVRRDDRPCRPSAPGNRARGCSSPGDRRTGLRAAARAGSTVPVMQKSASASMRQAVALTDHPHAAAAQRAGEGQLAACPPAAASRRPASSPAARRRRCSRETARRVAIGRGMMHADAAVDLVVQPDLAVRLVLAAARAARGTCRGSNCASPGASTSSV